MRGFLITATVWLVALSGCNDRALGEDLEQRIHDACESNCMRLTECVPVPPPGAEELWERSTDECIAECSDGFQARFDGTQGTCPEPQLDLTECIASKDTCEAYRSAYFMDGDPSASCYSEREAVHECEPAILPPAPFPRWDGIPTP